MTSYSSLLRFYVNYVSYCEKSDIHLASCSIKIYKSKSGHDAEKAVMFFLDKSFFNSFGTTVKTN